MKTVTVPRLTAALSALAVAAAALPAMAQSTVNKSDAATLVSMAQANMAEVDAGKMALDKTKRADVKQFAQMMIDDHGKALDEVKTLAGTKSVTLPAETDAAHKAMAAKLAKLSDAAFDKEYIAKAGVDDHTKVAGALKKDADKARDADVKALATKMIPTVEHHLGAAKNLQTQPKK